MTTSTTARFDRELAAAFRRYGLDLDTAGPPTAREKLAGRPSTPEIAAVIDTWCLVSAINTEVDKIAPTANAIAGHRSRPLA